MDKSIEQVIEDARKTAKRILGSTDSVRDAVAAGSPNSSPVSTVEGTLKAMKFIVDNHTPSDFTRTT